MQLTPFAASDLQRLYLSQVVQSFCQTPGTSVSTALNRFSSISCGARARLDVTFSLDFGQLPRCGCLPAPRLDYCGAPAGKGLSKDPEGFPKGSIRTAGGYTVVPGVSDVKIFGPDKKWNDGPDTHIWGDPHVNEKDGTRWDFTRNSNFRLPDGTLIDVQTSAQTGASVTKGITVVNGADRIEVTDMMTQPKVGDIRHDGYIWRNEHLAANPNQDTFVLGGDAKNIRWFKEKNGVIEGEVTGATVKNGAWEQVLNKDQRFWVSPELRPTLGSNAWGNQLRSNLLDGLSRSDLAQPWRENFAEYLNVDHWNAQQLQGQVTPDGQPFGATLDDASYLGGLARSFPNLGRLLAAITGLGNEMLGYEQLSNQLRWPLVSA